MFPRFTKSADCHAKMKQVKSYNHIPALILYRIKEPINEFGQNSFFLHEVKVLHKTNKTRY